MRYRAVIATNTTTMLGSAVQVTTVQVAPHAVWSKGWFYSIVLSRLPDPYPRRIYTMRIQMAQFECGHVHAIAFHWLIWMKQEYITLMRVRAITFLAGCKPITYVKDRI